MSRPLSWTTFTLVPLAVLLAAANHAVAQYSVTSWTTENGLPQSSVIAIDQTPDGFLWVTTLGGLARFDGRTFQTFDTTTNPELPHTRFAGVRTDAEGQLWVTLQTGQLLRFTNGQFELMGPAHGLPDGLVLRIAPVSGQFTVETTEGIAVWRDGRFVVDPAVQPPPPSSGLTFAGFAPGASVRWYRDRAGRAHRVENGQITRSIDLPGGAIREDRSGRVWSLVLPAGTLVVADTDGNIRHYGRDDGLLPAGSFSGIEEPDGTIWYPARDGLNRFRDGVFTPFGTADGLPDALVRVVFLDREGSLWVGTNRGLARFVRKRIVSKTSADGLSADNTYPILEDRAGTIWIGGWPGLSRYVNGRFENVPAHFGLATRNVLSLMEHRDGSLWVGTIGDGIRRIAADGVTTVAGSAPLSANVLYQAAGGDVWVGTDRGLYRYRDGNFTRIVGFVGEIGAVFQDAVGTIWVGTMDGLARAVDDALVPVGVDAGFTGRRVRAIHQDSSGTLWFGTYDTGVFRYRNGRFTRFTVREGLPTNGAFRFLEDGQGHFWISSNVGIYRVDRSALDDVAEGRRRIVTAVLYGRDDGMANQECNGLGQPAGIRARDGRYWFPTQMGVAIIDPAAMTINTSPPPVAFLDVSVGGFPVTDRRRVEIRSPRAEFRARYAALTFIRPELARYRYRMEGLDPDWIEAGTDRTVRYSDLPYGTFTFRVIAANRDGVWNETGTSLEVVVFPPFYRRPWFAGLVVLVVGLTAFGSHRSRLRAVEKRRVVQEAFARQLIDTQEIDRKRIASELHDGVSQTLVVIKNWAQLSGESQSGDPVVQRRMHQIADAAAQALGEVREVVHELLPYHLERLGLSGAIREVAGRTAEASGIRIDCACDGLDGQLTPETQLRLYRIVQEALGNMVKHSGATSAQIRSVVDALTLRVTITDDGRGFDPGAVVPTTPGHGFGLVSMAERARMMGGAFTISSSPGAGTTVIIEVPRAAATGAPA
ncbi:MAG: hypothetical protein AMXMBFR57_26220 [Acidimicrobiia bacterium]